MLDKRKERVDFFQPVDVELPGARHLRLPSVNLSEGGIFLRTSQAPLRGSRLCVTLPGPSGSLRIEGAEVAWRRAPGLDGAGIPGIGIRFPELTSAARRTLEEILEHARRAAPPIRERTSPPPPPMELLDPRELTTEVEAWIEPDLAAEGVPPGFSTQTVGTRVVAAVTLPPPAPVAASRASAPRSSAPWVPFEVPPVARDFPAVAAPRPAAPPVASPPVARAVPPPLPHLRPPASSAPRASPLPPPSRPQLRPSLAPSAPRVSTARTGTHAAVSDSFAARLRARLAGWFASRSPRQRLELGVFVAAGALLLGALGSSWYLARSLPSEAFASRRTPRPIATSSLAALPPQIESLHGRALPASEQLTSTKASGSRGGRLPPARAASGGTLRSPTFSQGAKGWELSMRADRPVEVRSFPLAEPQRLVVDFPDLDTEGPRTLRSPLPSIAEVRVGKAAGRTRVVVEFRGEMPAHELRRTSDGVVLALAR